MLSGALGSGREMPSWMLVKVKVIGTKGDGVPGLP